MGKVYGRFWIPPTKAGCYWVLDGHYTRAELAGLKLAQLQALVVRLRKGGG